MLRSVRLTAGVLATGLVSFALGIVYVPHAARAQGQAGPQWKDVVPEPELAKLIDESAKRLQNMTKNPGAFNQAAGKKSPNNEVQNEAYIVALYAQGGMKQTEGETAKKYAAVRDAALQLADAAAGQKLPEAQKHVAVIASFPKDISPAADAKELPLTKTTPLPNLMKQVNALDGRFNKDFAKGRIKAPQFAQKGFVQDLTLASERMAAFTMAVSAHVPEKDEKGKPRKVWMETSAGVRAATLNMVAAAKAKNGPGFQKAFNDMQTSCAECHKHFRDVDE